jgi:hypothetical protein
MKLRSQEKLKDVQLRERFENGLDKLGGWKHNPDERTQRI